MTPARKALALTIRYGQHIDLSDGVTLYVCRRRTDRGQGDQTRIILLCPEEIRINLTERYGPEAGTRTQYQKSQQQHPQQSNQESPDPEREEFLRRTRKERC